MQIYLVGGAVRDALLGLPVKDRDWVVVGATPQQMIDLGYQPVGRDFPVFLHPQTKEEYALARTERKTGSGYRGFVVHADPDVTLEEDLARRDLTMNSIAIAREDLGKKTAPIDPYHGMQDILNGVFRHTTGAFREDPVRLLRLARFAARFSHFKVANETMQLMQAMVQAGEVQHLVAERVWQEFASGLMESMPSRLLEVLRTCGALDVILPELNATDDPQTKQIIDAAAGDDAPLEVRWACLMRGLDPQNRQDLQQTSKRLRVPTGCNDLAALFIREQRAIALSAELTSDGQILLLERCDAFRNPHRFELLLQTYEICARNTLLMHSQTYQADIPETRRLRKALALGQSVDTASVAAQAARLGAEGPDIGLAISAARAQAVERAQSSGVETTQLK